jgi:hypothetical protein
MYLMIAFRETIAGRILVLSEYSKAIPKSIQYKMRCSAMGMWWVEVK